MFVDFAIAWYVLDIQSIYCTALLYSANKPWFSASYDTRPENEVGLFNKAPEPTWGWALLRGAP